MFSFIGGGGEKRGMKDEKNNDRRGGRGGGGRSLSILMPEKEMEITTEKLRTLTIQPRLMEKPISHIYRPPVT